MKTLLTILLSISFCFVFSQETQSTPLESSERHTVDYEHGEIVTSSTGRYSDGKLDISRYAYQDEVFAIFDKMTNRIDETFIQNGITEVKITSSNGEIKRGDYLCSSDLTGTAMKATKSGMMIGVALEDAKKGSKYVKLKVQISWISFDKLR